MKQCIWICLQVERICVKVDRKITCAVYAVRKESNEKKKKIGLLLAVNHYLIAGSIFWAGLGFSGRGWLWGPVRVNAEFLGETHVSSLGCHLTSAAKPGQTLASWAVDAPLEITKPPKYHINKLKLSFFIACRGCLRSEVAMICGCFTCAAIVVSCLSNGKEQPKYLQIA